MKVLGFVLILAAIAALVAIYHAMMQDMYEDAMKEKLQERFDREIEFRWQNQDIKVHQVFSIVDEMR